MMGNKSTSKRKFSTCDEKFELAKIDKATFGMQCFWDAETLFGCVPGVVRSRVGYAGGDTPDPTSDNTGDHTEVIELEFEPKKTSYLILLDIFWKNNNTTNPQTTLYQSTIFYNSKRQKKLADESLIENRNLLGEICTKIRPVGKFYNAASDQQKYYLQKDQFVMAELGYDVGRLIRSHIATRLNAYVVSSGDLMMFDYEKEEFGLSPELEEYIRKKLSSTPNDEYQPDVPDQNTIDDS